MSIRPGSRSYPGPSTVTFSGTLALNGHGIRTDHLRIFSVKSHQEFATVKTDASGAWSVRHAVTRSDWFFAMYSGSESYQPALSSVTRITIGNRAAVR